MDRPMQAGTEQKSVLSEALDLEMALQDILGMIRESMPTTEGKLSVPESSLKLDSLRNTLLDCKDITKQIANGLRLLV